ncbi:MAG: dihydrofolate reductase family protein [Acidobacteriia bacterium]|nr:dihydrofolate reductase family protein [Terriglobia bacterium]
MRKFEVLFDEGEASPVEDAAYGPYGRLGFPPVPAGRPWIFSNFVQSLDGIVSFKGKHAAGADISRSQEDRWLMDLLRAHADAVLIGVNTLRDETELGERPRGPVFRIMDPELCRLRQKLGKRREMNILVTGAATLDLSAFRVFDGELVDAVVVTTNAGAKRLAEKRSHPHLKVIASGGERYVDLRETAGRLRRELGIEYLLCEGGPTLYGYLSRAGLVDEKFVTVSPVEVGQLTPPEQERSVADERSPSPYRPTTFNAPGFTVDNAPWWKWVSCRKVGEHQFSRYRRK